MVTNCIPWRAAGAEWANKVPFEQGGALVKPHWDGAEMPKEPRSDFQAGAHSGLPALLSCGQHSAPLLYHIPADPAVEARTAPPSPALQIFFQERADDIWAANPAISASDRPDMMSAASVFWQEQLTPEQRAAYRERAAAEKAAAAQQIAEVRFFCSSVALAIGGFL